MHQIFNKIKKFSLLCILIGAILFITGYFLHQKSIKKNISNNQNYRKENIINEKDQDKYNKSINNLVKKSKNQFNNRPWSAFYITAYLFFGVSTTALFFLCIEIVAQSGWSIILFKLIQAIASFIPYACFFIFLLVISSLLDWNHIFHWMEDEITNPKSDNFDVLIALKKNYLNKSFFFLRVIFYFIGFIFLNWELKKSMKKLDVFPTKKNYWLLYKKSIIIIIFFSFCSMIYAWDLIMSIDPHWYSTLFGWYLMVSHLTTSIAFLILFSILLKKIGYLPLFNNNHLHDLSKYLFGFSLLWTYLWFAQFMLSWYANIPEESIYFLGRYNLYKSTFFTMLIPNFCVPLLLLMGSMMKRNKTIVFITSIIVILGHWLDFFNAIMPGTTGSFGSIGLLEIGSFISISSFFIFITINELSKIDPNCKKNPFYKESIYHKVTF